MGNEEYPEGDDDGGLTGNKEYPTSYFLQAVKDLAGAMVSSGGVDTERRLAAADEDPPSERYFREALEKMTMGGRLLAAESETRQQASEEQGEEATGDEAGLERPAIDERGPDADAIGHGYGTGASDGADGGQQEITQPMSSEEYLKMLAGVPAEPRDEDQQLQLEEQEQPREEDHSPYESDHVTQQEQEQLQQQQHPLYVQEQALIAESQPYDEDQPELPSEVEPLEDLRQSDGSDQQTQEEQYRETWYAQQQASIAESGAEGAVVEEQQEQRAELQEGLRQPDQSDQWTQQEREDEEREQHAQYIQQQAPIVGSQPHPDDEGEVYENLEPQEIAEPREGLLQWDQSNQREQLEQQSRYYVQQHAPEAELQQAHSPNQLDQQTSPGQQQQEEEKEEAPAYVQQEVNVAESHPHPAEGDDVDDRRAHEEHLDANQFPAVGRDEDHLLDQRLLLQQPDQRLPQSDQQTHSEEREHPQQQQQALYDEAHPTQQEQQEHPQSLYVQHQAPVAESQQHPTTGNVVVDQHEHQTPLDETEFSQAGREDRSSNQSMQRPQPVQRKQPQRGPRLSYAEKQQALAALYQAQHQT